MAMKKSVFCLIVLAVVSIAGVLEGFDYGSGLFLTSGNSLVKFRQLPLIQAEMGITNYYSFSPLSPEERLFDSDWGVLLSRGKWRGAVHAVYRNSFDILHEFSTMIQSGVLINGKITVNGAAEISVLSVPNDRDTEMRFSAGTAYHFPVVSIYSEYEISHISTDPERSIPLGELDIGVLLRDNLLGSQGVVARWNHTDKQGAVIITQKYSLFKWLTLAASFRSFPVEIGLSFSIEINRVQSSVLFKRHSELGWSHSGVVVYQK